MIEICGERLLILSMDEKEDIETVPHEIYLHTNKINGKKYVGYTKNKMMNRWIDHISDSRTNKNNYFKNALQKYGKDNWDHEVLETVIGLAAACEAEIKWISYYKSNQKEFGYNSTSGGDKFNFTEEIKLKLSEKAKAQMTPEFRAQHSIKMKEYWKTHENPFKGKKHKPETLAILSEKSRKYQEIHGNPWTGKQHSIETRQKMSEISIRNSRKEGFVSNLKKVSYEQRVLNGKKRAGVSFTKLNKSIILEKSKNCKTKAELSRILNISPAHLNWGIKKFNILIEINNNISKNKTKLTKELLINESKNYKNKNQLAKAFNYSLTRVCQVINENNLDDKLHFKNDIIKINAEELINEANACSNKEQMLDNLNIKTYSILREYLIKLNIMEEVNAILKKNKNQKI